MSDTPRTDDHVSFHPIDSTVDADFARELERELNVCLARNTEFQADVIRIAGELAAANERIDWMEEHWGDA